MTAAGTPGQSAAAQTAGALVAVEPQQNGVTRLTISMAPPAIGSVTIHVDQTAGGNAAIAVTATHPATLAALQNDHAALTQALTIIGNAPHHQTISFHLEMPALAQNAAAATAGQSSMTQGGMSQGAMSQGAMPQGGNGQAGLANGQNGGNPGGQRNGSAPGSEAAFAQGASRRDTAVAAAGITGQSRLYRFGLDVTA